MVNFTTLIHETDGFTHWVWLNRPDKKNALSRTLATELTKLVDTLGKDRQARLLILSAKGDVFCAGADLKERASMSEKDVSDFLTQLNSTLYKLEHLPFPSISALPGPALGGGCEIAFCTDFRVMASSAFLSLPETSLGIIPGLGGTQRLTRLVGTARATEMIFTGSRISAETAALWGLVNRVAKDGDVEAEAKKLGEAVLQNAPLALREAKRAIRYASWAANTEDGLRFESECYKAILKTEDRKEALAAFAEKRKPKFRGQ